MDPQDLEDWLRRNDINLIQIKDEKSPELSENLVEYLLNRTSDNFSDTWTNIVNQNANISKLAVAILLYNLRIYKSFSMKDAFKDLQFSGTLNAFKKIVKKFPQLAIEVQTTPTNPAPINPAPTNPAPTNPNPIPNNPTNPTNLTPNFITSNYYTTNPRSIYVDEKETINLYDFIASYDSISDLLQVLSTIPPQIVLFIWYATHDQVILADLWSSAEQFIAEYTQYTNQFVQKPETSGLPVANVLDSDNTLAYKYAVYYRIPPSFIYNENDTYHSMYQDFSKFGGTLNEIYAQVIRITPNLTVNDVANLYYNEIKTEVSRDGIIQINEFLGKEVDPEESSQNLIDDLEKSYNEWINRLQADNLEAERINNRIVEVQNNLLLITGDSIQSPIRTLEITLIFTLSDLFTSEEIQDVDGLKIFNNAVPNSMIPLITYVEPTRKLTKIYTGKIIDISDNIVRAHPNYDFIIPDSAVVNDPYTMYLQLWYDQKGEPGKTTYKLIKYDLKNNQLIVPFRDLTVKDKKIEIRNKIKPLQLNFPTLDFRKYTIKSLNVEVEIYDEKVGIQIDPASFLHLVLLDSRFNTYFYVSEETNPAGSQKALVLRYNSFLDREISTDKSVMANLTVTILQQKGKKGGKYLVAENGEYLERTFTFDMPYLKLEISNAKSSTLITQFLDIFLRLLKIYSETRLSIEFLYDSILRPLSRASSATSGISESMSSLRIASSRPSMLNVGERDKLRELQKYKVFKEAKDYSRVCQKKLQPIIIAPEDRENWENRTYVAKDGRTLVNLKVLEFHTVEDGVLLIACDPETFDTENKRKPEPYFKENTKTSNRDQFPFLPCCGSKRRDYTSNLGEQFNKTLTPVESSKIKSSGILEAGTIANVSVLLNRFLKTSDPESVEIKRKGVIDDNNNLIHCLFTALNKNYNIASPADKIKMGVAKRVEIINKYNPLLCKAELYDSTEEEILISLKNDKLDPDLHYRLLEESFDVNIWTFYEPTYNFQTLSIPRHKLFHTRAFNPDRNSILLYRSNANFGNFSTSLIFDSRNTGSFPVFGKSMTTILYKLFLALHSHNFTLYTNKIITYNNICNLFNYQKLFSNLEGQILDNYGKLRAVILRIDNELATITVFPGAPLNLPIREASEINYETIIGYFKDPPKRAVYENGKGIGFWYSAFDYEMAFFVRTKPWDSIIYGNVELKLPEGDPDPLPKRNNKIVEYRKVQRLARILFQLIEWVYTIGYVENRGPWLDQFSDLLKVSPGDYNFIDVDYLLPVLNTVDNALRWIATNIPTLFTNGRLRIYTDLLKSKIIDKLKEFNKGIDGIVPIIPREMVQLYEYPSDFKIFRNVVTFLSFSEIEKWKTSIDHDAKDNYIYTELTSDILKSIYPIVYGNEGRLWLIQNTITHTLETAIFISEYWNQHKVNLGYTSNPDNWEIKDYTLYIIGIENQLIIESTTNANAKNHILKWADNRYSPMLSIL